MNFDVTSVKDYNITDVDDNNSFCEASRFTLDLASQLGLSNDDHLGSLDEDVIRTKDTVNILKTIESKKNDLLEIRKKIKQCESLIEAKHVISGDVHLHKCQDFEKVIDHMSIIINKSEELRNRLQSPLMSDALNIHSSYHRYVLQLFSTISLHLKEFEVHLDTLNKGSRLDFQVVQDEYAVISSEAKKQIAELQTTVHYLEKFRSSLHKLHLSKFQPPSENQMNSNNNLLLYDA